MASVTYVLNPAYAHLPMLPYQRTSVSMGVAVSALHALDMPVPVKRAVYVSFRIESANGHSGVNENYCGAQADGSRWPEELDHYYIGVVQKAENQTGHVRWFLAFADVRGSLAWECNRFQARGLFVGGHCDVIAHMDVPDVTALCRAYRKSWVSGDAAAEPGAQELADFASMYRQAEGLFADVPSPAVLVPSPTPPIPVHAVGDPAREHNGD